MSSRTRAAADGRVLWIVNPRRAGLLGWLFRYLAYTSLAVAVGLVGLLVVIVRHYEKTLPDIAQVTEYHRTAPGVSRILAADGTLLAELAREHRAYAPMDEIPERIAQAFVAVEDRRFYEHGGLDYRGLARALVTNLRSGGFVQGGSTITQQVAKSLVGSEQTLDRKIREALFAVQLENALSKDRILEIYLNKIYLGDGAYGVAAAASRYFGRRLDELSLGQAALLAGLARAPSAYNPRRHPDRARSRRKTVLDAMVAAGYVTADEAAAAADEPIELAQPTDVFRRRAPFFAETVRQALAARFGERVILEDGLRVETPLDPFAQAQARAAVDDAVRRLDHRQGFRGPEAHLATAPLRERFGRRCAERYGPTPFAPPGAMRLALVVEVTRYAASVACGEARAHLPLRYAAWAAPYDPDSGENGRRIADLRESLEPGDVVWVRVRSDEHRRSTDPADRPLVALDQTPKVEAALYSMELDTGYVFAIQGGHDFDRSQFDRTTKACRQPGSVFKAIYYALALDTGRWTMASILEDKPYQPEPGEAWNPQNIHGTAEGEVLLRNAFIHSLNLPSIRLFQRLGADSVVAFARALGIESPLIADKALSLGASCVRMEELARAFAIFARGGTWVDPTLVRRVLDKHGATLLDRRHPYDPHMSLADRFHRALALARTPPRRVVDPRTAFLATQMMVDVVRHGIGMRAQRIGVPAGGKSGTASKGTFTTDTWFVGFTSRYVTVAWMGDDRYERSLGDEEASYTTATPLWTDYMKPVVEGVPHTKLPLHTPQGIVRRVVDERTGAPPLPGQRTATLYFRTDAAARPPAP